MNLYFSFQEIRQNNCYYNLDLKPDIGLNINITQEHRNLWALRVNGEAKTSFFLSKKHEPKSHLENRNDAIPLYIIFMLYIFKNIHHKPQNYIKSC